MLGHVPGDIMGPEEVGTWKIILANMHKVQNLII